MNFIMNQVKISYNKDEVAWGGVLMERTIIIQIEKLPEGPYLATSNDVQGLVAQGRTVAETIEIARDVAKKLLEVENSTSLPEVADNFSYPIVVG